MTPTTTLHAAAADALAQHLPTATGAHVAARPAAGSVPADLSSAVVVSFVGSTSADLAVLLLDTAALAAAGGTASPLVSTVDVLHPALEAAMSVLGNGVLGEARIEDAAALFADSETAVFELAGADRTAATTAVGWFAIRIRENGTINGKSATSDESVMGKLGRINNVEMALTVEIGRTRMSVRDVLDLEPGGVIELDRSAGSPADILLNGRLIAHGEVVVVDQDYAVRITKILDVAEGFN